VAEKIGDYLVRIGAMTPAQVARVVQLQKAGDTRRFGVIAEELHFITNYEKIKDFLAALER